MLLSILFCKEKYPTQIPIKLSRPFVFNLSIYVEYIFIIEIEIHFYDFHANNVYKNNILICFRKMAIMFLPG